MHYTRKRRARAKRRNLRCNEIGLFFSTSPSQFSTFCLCLFNKTSQGYYWEARWNRHYGWRSFPAVRCTYRRDLNNGQLLYQANSQQLCCFWRGAKTVFRSSWREFLRPEVEPQSQRCYPSRLISDPLPCLSDLYRLQECQEWANRVWLRLFRAMENSDREIRGLWSYHPCWFLSSGSWTAYQLLNE